MNNLLKKDRSEEIIILDKNGTILFNTTNINNIRVFNDSDISNLMNIKDTSFVDKNQYIDINKTVNNKELGQVIIFKNKDFNIGEDLLRYKDISTGLYKKALIEDIQKGSMEFNYLKEYSIIYIEINSVENSDYDYADSIEEQMIIDLGKLIISKMREQDIMVHYRNNSLLIITPVVERELLNNIMKRIKNTVKLENISNYNIDIIEASSSLDTTFMEMLKNLEKDMYEEKKKKKFLRFEIETDISSRIEKVRQELNSMISSNNGILLDDQIIEISQYLDKLLVAHVKNMKNSK